MDPSFGKFLNENMINHQIWEVPCFDTNTYGMRMGTWSAESVAGGDRGNPCVFWGVPLLGNKNAARNGTCLFFFK